MAIAQKPRLLMLDEPTQGLSIEETGRAVQILKDMLAEGDLSVLVERRHGSGVQARRQHHRAASRRVIADGSPAAVRGNAQVRSAYLGGADVLRVEDLHTYYGQGHVLRGVELEVPAGRIAAVLGRRGRQDHDPALDHRAHAAAATCSPGKDVAGWPPHRIARVGLGYVPEGRMIFPDLTVVENIQVAQRVPARHWTIERLFGLFPALAERRRSKGSQLSGGEQQMLAVARAGHRSARHPARRALAGPRAAGGGGTRPPDHAAAAKA